MPRTKKAFEAMRQTTREKIDAAALALFARKGLSVKVGEISEAAGISQGLLYSHYASKDALIIELARQATVISGQSIQEIAQNEALAAEKIRMITTMMCQMFAENHIGIDYFMFMVQVGMSGVQIPDAALYTVDSPNPLMSLAQIVALGQIEGTVVDGDPLGLSAVYWAAIQGLSCYAVTGMTLSPEPRTLNRILLKESFL